MEQAATKCSIDEILVNTEPRWLDERNRLVIILPTEGGMFYEIVRSLCPGTADRGWMRLRTPLLPLVSCRKLAARNLYFYALHRRGWRPIPNVDTTRTALELVMPSAARNPELTLAIVERWTEIERTDATSWALLTHLRASDNCVRIPPVPGCVIYLMAELGLKFSSRSDINKQRRS